MKNSKLTIVVMILVFHTGIAGAAESSLCPGYEALMPSPLVFDLCGWSEEKSMADCLKFVHDLENLKNPTPQQKFDLAIASRELSNFYTTHPTKTDELIDRSIELFRSLEQELPNDISVLFNLNASSTGDESLSYLRRILVIAPDCSDARYYLLEDLE